jgi:hypothetical protein
MYKPETNFIPPSKFEVLFLPMKDFGEHITYWEPVPFSRNPRVCRIRQSDSAGHSVLPRVRWGDFRVFTGPDNSSQKVDTVRRRQLLCVHAYTYKLYQINLIY